MVICRTCCVLCGAPVDDEDGFPPWMSRFRVVYTIRENWDKARLSGIGQRRQLCDVIPLEKSVAAEVDVSECKVDEAWVQVHLMKDKFGEKWPPDPPITPQPLWGFPVHCSCWKLMKTNDTCSRFESPVFIQAFFDICRSQPFGLALLNWGHEYGGIHRFTTPVSRLLPTEEPDLAYWGEDIDPGYCHDPNDFSFFDLNTLYEAGTHRYAPALHQRTAIATSISDPFQGLSQELILTIFAELPSDAVCSLRIASRFCALTELCETFWRSRFLPGREFHSLLWHIQQLSMPGKWAAAYTTARHLCKSPAMTSLRRVWSLVCYLTDLIHHRLQALEENSSLIQLAATRTTMAQFVELSRAAWNEPGERANSALYDLSEGFPAGSRALFRDSADIQRQICQVSFSLVRINGKRYIAGLEISQDDGIKRRIGYYSPKSSTSLFLNDSRSLETLQFLWLHLAIDAWGIRGMRFCCNSPCDKHDWVGDSLNIPKKILRLNNIRSIQCDFDALKMLSVHFQVSALQTTGAPQANDYIKSSCLWLPDVPDSVDLPSTVYPTTSEIRMFRFLPYSYCVFGGQAGQLLPLLSRLVLWGKSDDDAAVIHCIEFQYGSSEEHHPSLELGRKPDPDASDVHRQVLEIESAKGERISNIEIYHLPVEPHLHTLRTMRALTFHTTHGKSVEFPNGWASHIDRSDEVSSTSLNANNNTIVGLYANLLPKYMIRNLGILVQRNTER